MATDTGGGVPTWLLDCKESITRSKEWEYFIDELHDAVEQQLTESHVKAFTDLTDAERALFLDRAARAIKGGTAYGVVQKAVSRLLDQYLSNTVAKQLTEGQTYKSKSDLILEGAQDGVLSLLRMWPDLKFKLHACFNVPLPRDLRRLSYRLFLENQKVRKQYNDLLQSNPRKAISPKDLDISRKCEHLLMSEPTFQPLNGSVGAFYAMKAVLSYRHTTESHHGPLADTDYMLIVPLVYSVAEKLSRSDPAPTPIVAVLVEEYFSFMATRPLFMISDGSNVYKESQKLFADKVARHLNEKCPEAAALITKIYVPSPEQIVATESGSLAIIAHGVTALMCPVIQSMFVGYLSLDTIQFLWDQYVIGVDCPGFHDVLLPALAAIHIILLKDKLQQCSSPAAMESALKKESSTLKAAQFQFQITQHFFNELCGVLMQNDRASLPVLDPTQVKTEPWTHWHQDKLPSRTGADERRVAREVREDDRLYQVQEYKERQTRRDERERQEKERQHQEVVARTVKAQQEVADERRQLYDQLELERQRRIDAERRAQDQIDSLRQEIESLKKRPVKSAAPSVHSMGSVWSDFPGPLVPPATPATAAPSTHPPPTPRPAATPKAQTPKPQTPKAPTPKAPTPQEPSPEEEEQTKEAMLNFMKRVANGFNTVAHGNGAEREELDKKTKDRLQRAP